MTSTIDKAVLRRISSLLDESDDGVKVVIDMGLFTTDTTPAQGELQKFHERHCPDLDFDSVKGLLKDLLLEKRSVSVKEF